MFYIYQWMGKDVSLPKNGIEFRENQERACV
jgi:hypothetical protein